MRQTHHYPSMIGESLIDALATHYSVSPSNLVVGGGSIALLQHTLNAYAGAGDEVIFAWRSYEAYPILVTVAGSRPVPVPLTADHKHDIDAILAAVTKRTAAIIVCNPNNPTGTVIDESELTRLLDAVPPHVLILLDEAYWEFNTTGVDGFVLAADRPNVVVLRTFSKAYGLAGARVGYLCADAAVAETIRAVAPPFGLSAPAEAAASAALQDQAHVDTMVARVIAERARLREGLAALDVPTPPTEANFVWLPLRDRGAALEEACISRGVSVRRFPEGVRVTVGQPEVGDAVIDAGRSLGRAD